MQCLVTYRIEGSIEQVFKLPVTTAELMETLTARGALEVPSHGILTLDHPGALALKLLDGTLLSLEAGSLDVIDC